MDDISSIPKMKVADLKKHLKSIGLPVTGNKTELVERLQKAFEAEIVGRSDSLNASGAGEEEEFDEEEILGDDVDDEETSKITPQEEDEVLSGTLRIKPDSLILQTEKKKITLNRSEPSLKAAVVSPTKDEAPTTTTVQTTEQIEESEPDKENSQDHELMPKRKLIRLSADTPETEEPAPSTPTTTAVLKKDAQLTEDEKKQARMARFGSVNTRPGKLSMETGGIDMEKLKKRAERFGEVTSKSLTKIDSLEKMKAREERFGSATEEDSTTEKSASNGVNSDEAKAARAARFGVNGTEAKTTTSTLSEDELKKKRAERFAAN